MHGMIFQQLQKFVTTTADYTTWQLILKEANLQNEFFLPNQIYPDEKAQALVVSASKVFDMSVELVLESFGFFLSKDLLFFYARSIPPEWKTLDLVEHTETNMHRVVRLKDKTTEPPKLLCNRIDDRTVTIEYSSKRNMLELGIGIIKGIAKHYNEEVQITVINKEDGVRILEVVKMD